MYLKTENEKFNFNDLYTSFENVINNEFIVKFADRIKNTVDDQEVNTVYYTNLLINFLCKYNQDIRNTVISIISKSDIINYLEKIDLETIYSILDKYKEYQQLLDKKYIININQYSEIVVKNIITEFIEGLKDDLSYHFKEKNIGQEMDTN